MKPKGVSIMKRNELKVTLFMNWRAFVPTFHYYRHLIDIKIKLLRKLDNVLVEINWFVVFTGIIHVFNGEYIGID